MCKNIYTLTKAHSHTHMHTWGQKLGGRGVEEEVWLNSRISRTSAHAYTWTHTSSRWLPVYLTGSTVSGCVEASQLLVNQQWLTVYTCTFWANRLHAYCKYTYTMYLWACGWMYRVCVCQHLYLCSRVCLHATTMSFPHQAQLWQPGPLIA